MKKKLISFLLFAALLVLPLMAVAEGETADGSSDIPPYEDPAGEDAPAEDAPSEDGSGETLPEARFTDVPENAWYASVVAKAYSLDLISGVGEGRFNPDGNLSVAEAITMADRVHSIYHTGALPDLGESDENDETGESDESIESTPWYTGYINYALENGIISEVPDDCDKPVTRARFTAFLARSLPEEALPEISSIEDNSIPDVAANSLYYDDFYLLYRAGVLFGSDDQGSARPNDRITRAESASVLTRMADSSERRSITLTAAVTMYAEDGRTQVVNANEVAANEAVGWYRYPVTRVYSVTKGSRVIPVSEKDTYLKAGWYAQKIATPPSSLNRTTSLPIISINTSGSISSHSAYTKCTVSVYNVGQDLALSNVSGGIRLRGNASAAAYPPPYRIKFDEKQNMAGLNDGAKMKSWVLLTDTDGAVDSIKNDIAFRFGRALLESDGYYCSDAKLVHVYLNGRFLGPYLLAEQNQVQKHRVAVTEPEEGYTGTDIGYFVELDNYYESPYFMMDYEKATVTDIGGTTRTFHSSAYSVKSDTYSQKQVDFISKYIRGVFKIIYQACEKGNYLTFDKNYNVVESSYKSAKEAVEAVADMRSFVDMYILYEIMHDYDVGESSFFMCVDFSDESSFTKLTLTAPWDFNWTCLGSTTTYYAATWCPSNIAYSSLGDRSNPWFIILYKQSWFRSMVKEKWADVGGSKAMKACIQEEISILDANQADVNRNKSGSVASGKYYLDWLNKRIEWLNGEWKK